MSCVRTLCRCLWRVQEQGASKVLNKCKQNRQRKSMKQSIDHYKVLTWCSVSGFRCTLYCNEGVLLLLLRIVLLLPEIGMPLDLFNILDQNLHKHVSEKFLHFSEPFSSTTLFLSRATPLNFSPPSSQSVSQSRSQPVWSFDVFSHFTAAFSPQTKTKDVGEERRWQGCQFCFYLETFLC